MISGINPWFPILSIKILEYTLVFQDPFIDSIIEKAALKTQKLFFISTAAHQFRSKPAFFACNLHSFAIFGIVFFMLFFISWIMWRSLTSQIITITTKSDNVTVEDWSRFIYFFSRKKCRAKNETVRSFLLLLECYSLFLSALQRNRA